jgi:hypothetical protein
MTVVERNLLVANSKALVEIINNGSVTIDTIRYLTECMQDMIKELEANDELSNFLKKVDLGTKQ